MAYATQTDVSVEKSRLELEKILSKYGATRFAYMSTENEAVIAFQAHGKFVKFILPLPNRNDKEFRLRKMMRNGILLRTTTRTPEDTMVVWEQACRSRWRALCLCVKGKLEAVESGITTYEKEFLAHFVMPGGQTFGDYAIPKIEEATKSGRMPQLELMDHSTAH